MNSLISCPRAVRPLHATRELKGCSLVSCTTSLVRVWLVWRPNPSLVFSPALDVCGKTSWAPCVLVRSSFAVGSKHHKSGPEEVAPLGYSNYCCSQSSMWMALTYSIHALGAMISKNKCDLPTCRKIAQCFFRSPHLRAMSRSMMLSHKIDPRAVHFLFCQCHSASKAPPPEL